MIASSPERLHRHTLSTPLGTALLITDGQGTLRALDWTDFESRLLRLLSLHYGRHPVPSTDQPVPAALRRALEAYFDGELWHLDTLHCATGGSEFQRAVWAGLRGVEASVPCTYSELAQRIGRPKAVRAVGAANGANPIAVVVPCHRVIGKDGTLTGYAGGVARKRWLLMHEAKHAHPTSGQESVCSTANRSGPTPP